MIKPLIYVDVKKALKMSMISQDPSLYSELWISSHQSIQNIFWDCLPTSDTIMVRRKCEPETHTRSCFMYYSCNRCVTPEHLWNAANLSHFEIWRPPKQYSLRYGHALNENSWQFLRQKDTLKNRLNQWFLSPVVTCI